MNDLTAAERALAEDVMPDAVAVIDRQDDRRKDRTYPEPTIKDVLDIRESLRLQWAEWRYGTDAFEGDGDGFPTYGIPGLARIRAMRYHRDQMPAKWREQLNLPTGRYRSDLTHNEIERVVALATRNVPRVEIKAQGRSPEAQERAAKETRWAQHLIPALERQANKPLIRQFSDGVVEGGLAVWEVFLTDADDSIELRRREDETEEEYVERTEEALIDLAAQGRLPVGVRVPDPASVLLDFDDYGVRTAIIEERMAYRHIWDALADTVSEERLDEMRMPRPGDFSVPDGLGWDVSWGMPNGDVDVIRFYNRRWYLYIVGGIVVYARPHGFPGVPIIPAYGTTSSSSKTAEQFQGMVWGMIEQEQAINDRLTAEQDDDMTYGKPHPVVERSEVSPLGGPTTIDLSNPRKMPVLPVGSQVRDAYGGFQNRRSQSLLATMIGIRQQSGINPITTGEAPGSDPSGFAVNTLQASAQMRYEILFDNIGRSIGMLIDFLRKCIRYGPILDEVFIPVEMPEGYVDFISLSPEDVSSMPANAYVDPMNDVNRLAQRQSLIAGNQAGFVPARKVMEDGFGADDYEAWKNEIALDMAENQLIQLALEYAKMRVMPATVAPEQQESAGGRRAGDQAELERLGGVPTEPRGEAGRMGREAGNPPAVASSNRANAARSRGGQQPANQGVGENVPMGAR